MKKCATISADVVASSGFSAWGTEQLTRSIHIVLHGIEQYQRIFQREKVLYRTALGDMIECLVFNPGDALRIALMIKAGIKMLPTEAHFEDMPREFFREYGARIAIGVGEMNMDTALLDAGIWKGDAISRSGRLIAGEKTSDKERVTVKQTLFFSSADEQQTAMFQTIFALLDGMLNNMTAKQAELVFWKLQEHSEQQIALQLSLSQSSVNQRSTAAGWNAIEKAVKFFESTEF